MHLCSPTLSQFFIEKFILETFFFFQILVKWLFSKKKKKILFGRHIETKIFLNVFCYFFFLRFMVGLGNYRYGASKK